MVKQAPAFCASFHKLKGVVPVHPGSPGLRFQVISVALFRDGQFGSDPEIPQVFLPSGSCLWSVTVT